MVVGDGDGAWLCVTDLLAQYLIGAQNVKQIDEARRRAHN